MIRVPVSIFFKMCYTLSHAILLCRLSRGTGGHFTVLCREENRRAGRIENTKTGSAGKGTAGGLKKGKKK